MIPKKHASLTSALAREVLTGQSSLERGHHPALLQYAYGIITSERECVHLMRPEKHGSVSSFLKRPPTTSTFKLTTVTNISQSESLATVILSLLWESWIQPKAVFL